MVVLDPAGVELLLKVSFGDTGLIVVTVLIGIAALAGGVQNWFLRQTSRAEGVVLIAAGLSGAARRRHRSGAGNCGGGDAETAQIN